jgi:hypothetical protein
MPFGRKKTLLDRAQEYVEQVADTVIPQVQSALEDAAEKAGPAIADAREKARPLMEEGKTRAAEAATAGAAIAAAKAHAGREMAATKVNELRGVEPEPEGGGKLKKLLVVTGLLAIGGVIFSKLRSKDESANWQSSYTPAPPPKPTVGDATIPTEKASPAATPGSASASAGTGSTSDDIGGGDPGEALSDLAEEPHPATTPEAPAEVVEIDDSPRNDRL